MNKLQTFNHSDFGSIEAIEFEGKQWFGATKAALALGYVNPHDAISKHCRSDGVAKREVIDNLGRSQEMNFMDEGNLYRLIVKSRLPLAEKYERWVFDEVLPTIRKTGSYQMDQFALPQSYSEALRLAADLSDKNEALQLQAAYQEQQITLQAPKVALYDVAMSADGVQPVGTVAKELGLGRTRLFSLLREKKILRNNNEPYQEYIERGYFKLRMYTITHKSSGLENKTQPMVTPKGIAWLHKMLKEGA